MGGMTPLPRGTRWRRGSADRPATWLEWYYKGPESDGEEVWLGRSQRQERHLTHKFFPADGSWPQVFRGAGRGVAWLLEIWRSAKARSDAIRTTEDEQVLTE